MAMTTAGDDKAFLGLPVIQDAVAAWSQKNFGDQVSKVTGVSLHSLAPLLGIVEEVGELTHAVLKRHQGIRGMDVPEVYEKARDDALADILVYLCDFAAREGVDLMGVLASTWSQVSQRDWKVNPAGEGV